MAKKVPNPVGLTLTKAFRRIKESKLRRCIVDLVKEIAGATESFGYFFG